MKLERAQEYLTTFVAVVFGMFAAYYVGTLSGHGRFGMVGGLLATSAFLALLLALKEQIWLLIPLTIPLSGQLTEVRGHPAIKDLAVISVFAGVYALRAFKVIRRKPKYRAIDFWTGLVLLYLLTVYVRNPVGGEALGSERVGGRPYLDVFTAALGFWVLARVVLPARIAQRTFASIAALSFSIRFLEVVQILLPATAPVIVQLIGGSLDDTTSSTPQGEDEVGRKAYLAGVGNTLALGTICGYPPLTLLNPFRLFRFSVFFAGIICLLYSGFRSMIVNVVIMFYLATYLRGDFSKVLRVSVVGGVCVTLLVLMQGTIVNLPNSIQRSLSFLPGQWDRNVVGDADYSASWRYDMWERMLFTDRYIESKWFGDGFGMTANQLQQANATAAMNNSEQLKESYLVSGTVHSGPISTIKYTGYVGLFIYLCFVVTCAREGWVLCRMAKGTPYFSFALYVCVPVIYQPFNFVLIFGAFNSDLPQALIAAGMLKMLRTSVELYRATEAQPEAIPAPAYGGVTSGRPMPAHLQF